MSTTWIPCAEQMPKNGKKVLAYFINRAGKQRIICAYWTESKQIESGVNSDLGEYDENTDCFYDPQGWYEVVENCDYSGYLHKDGKISHWIPLPPYPDK